MKGKLKGLLLGAGAAVTAAGLLLFSQQVRSAVTQSIFYCLGTLVPSLFPFLVLSSFCVRAKVLQGRAAMSTVGWVVEHLFYLPRESAAAVLLGLIGGYPTGGKGAALLHEDGVLSKEQAGRMLLFCVSPGLAFTVTYLGGAVLQNTRLGWRLFFSITLAAVLLGVLTARLSGYMPLPAQQKVPKTAPQNVLSLAIADASKGVLTMCACIVLFSALTALLHASGIFQLCCTALSRLRVLTPMEAAVVLSFLWEVTGGTGAAQTLQVGAVFYAFGAGFGGLCVLLQVLSCFSKRVISLPKFFFARLSHGLLSAGIFLLWQHLSPVSEQAFVHIGPVHAVEGFSSTAAGGLSLLLLCAAFLVFLAKDPSPLEKKHSV